MYDVATQTVSKLSGELSSAFVEAAESNAYDEQTIPVPSTNSDKDIYIPEIEEDADPIDQFIDIKKITKRSDLMVAASDSKIVEEKFDKTPSK